MNDAVDPRLSARARRTSDDAEVSVFWTGGWESTFCVLHALLVRRKTVQPYYLLCPVRDSVPAEIASIRKVRRAITSRWPEASDRLRPLFLMEVAAIPKHPEITEAYMRLRARYHIGAQYEWLARFAHYMRTDAFEIGVERDLRGVEKWHNNLDYLLRNDDDVRRVFGMFRYPILNLTKRQLGELADQHGFGDIMEMTWFCHAPQMQFIPCSQCKPCEMTIEDGMAGRVPFFWRNLHRLDRITGGGLKSFHMRALWYRKRLRAMLAGRSVWSN